MKRTILLTGASRGIGHATVKRFMAEGWHVLTVSRQPFAKACPLPGGEDNHIQLDLSDIEGLQRALPDIRDRLPQGRLDALVNNAAISPKAADGTRLSALKCDFTVWKRVFDVNFFSTMLLSQGLSQELVAAKGAIINVTSIAGSRVHPFASSAYATSKAALAALTRELASEFGRHGVRVNAISPGEIDTSILSPGTEEIIAQDVPMQRVGLPQEVADAIFYLCSDRASYINGSEIHINGGQHV